MSRRRAASLVLLLAGCASEPQLPGSGGVPAGGVGEVPVSVAQKTTEGPAPSLQTFPAETQRFMEQGLRQFSAQDPRWEATRREWLAMGPRESEFLVQMLWAGLLAGHARHAPELVERARGELVLVGAPSIPLMAGVLRGGTMVEVQDPSTGASRAFTVDDQQRREAAEVLALIGAPSVPAVMDVLRFAESKSGRRFALEALGNMGDRGGPAASAELVRYAGDSDLALAVEAVHGMRNWRDADTRVALLGALASPEQLVREKAADALAGRLDKSVLPDLRQAAARARNEGHLAEAARIDRAATALERYGDERK